MKEGGYSGDGLEEDGYVAEWLGGKEYIGIEDKKANS